MKKKIAVDYHYSVAIRGDFRTFHLLLYYNVASRGRRTYFDEPPPQPSILTSGPQTCSRRGTLQLVFYESRHVFKKHWEVNDYKCFRISSRCRSTRRSNGCFNCKPPDNFKRKREKKIKWRHFFHHSLPTNTIGYAIIWRVDVKYYVPLKISCTRTTFETSIWPFNSIKIERNLHPSVFGN